MAAFAFTLGSVLLATIGSAIAAGPAPVLLGTAANFAILAKTGVATVPNSAVHGNVGVSPATVTSLTGFSLVQDVSRQFWRSTQVTGELMGATDALPTPGRLTVAVLDMQTAFTNAMSEPQPNFVGLKAGLIGGSILVPGLYKWTTGVTISTSITLAGGPGDTWIFQISGTLVQAANVRMTLIGGALSQNIIWVVANTVTVGTNAIFEGNVLAQTNVVIGTNAIDHGCIYAQTSVTLQKATVSCNGGNAVPPPSSSAGSSSLPPTSTPASSSPPVTVTDSHTSSSAHTISSTKTTCPPSTKPTYPPTTKPTKPTKPTYPPTTKPTKPTKPTYPPTTKPTKPTKPTYPTTKPTKPTKPAKPTYPYGKY